MFFSTTTILAVIAASTVAFTPLSSTFAYAVNAFPSQHLRAGTMVPSWFSAAVAAIASPSKSDVYTAEGLWAAIQRWDSNNPSNTFFSSGASTGSPSDEDKYMLAAYLGNVAQETGGLQYTTELAPPSYTEPCTLAACGSSYGKFWGRGSLQVTCWGGSPCSAYNDVVSNGYISSLDNIDEITTEAAAAWGSGLVFWMSNTGVGGKGPAAKYVSQKSFGGTYAVINGAIECPAGTGDSRVANRIKNFEAAATAMGVDVSSWTMTCPSVGPSPSPSPGTGKMFCGTSWTDANNKCSTSCDGTDAACASGEHCYADLTGC